jgi:hypothetical protein
MIFCISKARFDDDDEDDSSSSSSSEDEDDDVNEDDVTLASRFEPIGSQTSMS